MVVNFKEVGMKKLFLAIVVTFLLGGCVSYESLDYIKEKANQRWAQMGFEIVGYEGFQWGFTFWPSYGGAKVWYVLKRIPDNGITYGGFLQRWGDEIHMYNIRAFDAIKP